MVTANLMHMSHLSMLQNALQKGKIGNLVIERSLNKNKVLKYNYYKKGYKTKAVLRGLLKMPNPKKVCFFCVCVCVCVCTFNGERLPHSEQFAVCVDRDLKVQQGFVHDERIQGRRICPSSPTHTYTHHKGEKRGIN